MPKGQLALVEPDAPQFIEEKSHTYRGDDGPWQPGVTGLLKIQEPNEDTFALERWQIKTAGTAAFHASGGEIKDALDAAFDAIYEANRRGSRIHEGIDSLIGDIAHNPAPTDGGYWYAWSRFLMREKPEIFASEQMVIGDGFGGTFDLDAIVRGKRSLIDTKTGSYRDKYQLQLAGYSDAKWRAPKRTGQPVEPMPKFEAFYALLLAADGTYELKEVEVGKPQIEHFRFLVKTYHQLKAYKERTAA